MRDAERTENARPVQFAAWLLAIALAMAPVTAQAADPLTVCIKSDGIMRLLSGGDSCQAGETKELLARWQPEEAKAPTDASPEAGKAAQEQLIQDLSNRVAALEQSKDRPRPDKTEALRVDELSGKVETLTARITALENGKHRVTAPFEVVGPGGKTILGVGQFSGGQGISVIGADGSEAVISDTGGTIGFRLEAGDKKASLTAEQLELAEGSKKLVAAGGSLKMTDADDELTAAATALELTNGNSGFASLTAEKLDVNLSGEIGTTLEANGVKLMTGDDSIAELYRRAGAKNAALRIIRDGKNMAALGINEYDKGAMYVSDGERNLAAVQGLGEDTGAVDVFGPDGVSAAGLAVGKNGLGLIAVRDASGKPIAALQPSSDQSGGNITLWKGDLGVFSAGAASDGGGEACLNRVTGGGQQKLVCLGVGLPGFGGMP